MQVLASPFRVMKIMSEYFGYTVPVCPIEGGLTNDDGIFYFKYVIDIFMIQARCSQTRGSEELAYSRYKIRKLENCCKIFVVLL